MNHAILYENQKRRLTFSIGLLICFAMYSAWQMGYIYFMGPSLVIEGRTPLPISMDNITALIALGYVLSLGYMIVVPHLVVWAERITAILALISVLGLFLPLPDDAIRLLVYVQTFLCCFMIGFESFIIVNFFSEKSTIEHLTIAYAVSTFVIAIIQNDSIHFSFTTFRFLIIIMLVMALYFFFKVPTAKDACPIYVKKGDLIRPPKKLFIGIYSVTLISCLIALCGPTSAGIVKNGVFILYLTDSIGALILYVIYKKYKIHPLRSVSIFMVFSVIGFLCIFSALYVPSLAYTGCALVGLGMIPCQFLPLYGVVMMKSYPTKYIVPSIIGIALVTVILQSTLVEAFRAVPNMLNLVYMTIMVVLTPIYLRVEPFLIYTLNRKLTVIETVKETEEVTDDEVETAAAAEEPIVSDTASETDSNAVNLLATLTKRERQVLELISCGYSNGDIAKVLFISEHTVNDHTKKIYRKLDVHSRHAAASIINKYETVEK